ncbi:MAG: hypothetical protein EOS73_16115 [Mesorhizobium sp.]|uniref:hypothetical protein n=1 Tax=Mesorhizobium sp. M7A.F.Ca.ET.027.02.1.1 TaxID=2496655 RepID=UPI000FD5B620|nr:hypothetical protein [Mesorhizobium sp. M7A.F.Ca.ET.027.02.1.1]RVD14254.1 hypothetical protein EN749_20430 [Mesorhizobium sp. M7A.F.Ca.ET.027.02.1.1]RWD08204.1 MAG: hypothetical protein EOS73_16115 [Mesorhizobium sp.]
MNKFDEMLRRDDLWFQIAITVAALVFFSVAIGTLIALFAGSTAAIGERIDIVYKLGLIGAGLITFCTVVWRGLLATQQVDAQRRQLDKLSAQIVATENSNLAALLQKGAELIAEADKPARVAAGIASLRAVGEGTDNQFGVQAMDILADYIQQRQNGVFSDQVGMSAITALELIHKKSKRFANRTLNFHFETEHYDPEDDVRFELISGVLGVNYTGGYFSGIELTPSEAGATNYRFDHVRIFEGHVDFWCADMRNCFVKDAAILRIDGRRIYGSELVGCDFSDCKVTSPHNFPDLREGKNWFNPNRPPRSDIPDMDWSTKLHAGRPDDDDETVDDSIFY